MGNTIQCGDDNQDDTQVYQNFTLPNSALVKRHKKCTLDPTKFTDALEKACTSNSSGISATFAGSEYPDLYFLPNSKLCAEGTTWVQDKRQCFPAEEPAEEDEEPADEDEKPAEEPTEEDKKPTEDML